MCAMNVPVVCLCVSEVHSSGFKAWQLRLQPVQFVGTLQKENCSLHERDGESFVADSL